MAGTKSSALRNAQAERNVQNLDSLELKDGSGTVIATSDSTFGWGAASSGSVSPSADISFTGTANAGGGTDAASARLYDSGTSGEELTGLSVTATGNGGDLQLNNTNISDGQSGTLPASNAAITEPATTQ